MQVQLSQSTLGGLLQVLVYECVCSCDCVCTQVRECMCAFKCKHIVLNSEMFVKNSSFRHT